MNHSKRYRRFSPALIMGLLLLLCVGSRLLTAIFYIEDPDSLNFALSAKHFDITADQPHFPGYAAYVFLLQMTYGVTGSLGGSFAFLGGISIFLIIIGMALIFERPGRQLSVAVLILLNPFLWLMSTRYMPDIAGLAVLVLFFGMLSRMIKDPGHPWRGFLAGFALGILAGIRLSYLPAALAPALWIMLFHEKRWSFLAGGIAGGVIWALPFILLHPLGDMIASAGQHTEGHFLEWGGTILSDQGILMRFVRIAEYLWADLSGNWLYGRNWTTIASGILFIFFFIAGIKSLINQRKKNSFIRLIILSCIIYFIWIFFFQNVLYKPRHLMPLIIPVIALLGEGIYQWMKKTTAGKMAGIIYLAVIGFITVNLAVQHKKQASAVYQMKEFISGLEQNHPDAVLVTTELMKSYLVRQGISMDVSLDIIEMDENRMMMTTYPEFADDERFEVKAFYHNPFVNRMWPAVYLYIEKDD